jgi:hypothetical protein
MRSRVFLLGGSLPLGQPGPPGRGNTGQSGALSDAMFGAPLKIISGTGALGFLWERTLLRATLAPPGRGCTGQSGAPRPETLSLVFQLIFKSVFVLTCE